MAKSPEAMAASMIQNVKEKTGKTLAQWLKITAASGLKKHGELVKLLKGDHGVTHGYASLIAHQALAAERPDVGESDLVDAQYSGAKEHLLPIYQAVVEAVRRLGDDVEVSPKKTYVSLRRKKQFALIQPSTKDRVDLGVNLKGTSATERLELSGSFNSMVSHRVRLSSQKQVDREVKAWLKKAYQEAG